MDQRPSQQKTPLLAGGHFAKWPVLKMHDAQIFHDLNSAPYFSIAEGLMLIGIDARILPRQDHKDAMGFVQIPMLQIIRNNP